MAVQPLDVAEWESVLGKLLRYHLNISEEIKAIIAQIRKEMNQDLVPVAEDRANFGKVVKKGIRSMWALEYEIVDIQEAFAKQMGDIDIENLTDDFIEEMLLQSKPLQGVLHAIRERQKEKMDEMKKLYWEQVKDLEPLNIPRPPKPEPKPEQPEKKEEEKKPEEGEKKPEEGEKKPEEAEQKPEEPAAPVENAPEPAIDATAAPQAVEASA